MFLAFWTTLPGILTGLAALITAIAGLYIAGRQVSQTNANINPPPTPSPIASPSVKADSGRCYEEEFSAADQIEEGGNDVLHHKDYVIRVKFTDSGEIVGALRLRFHPGSSAAYALFKVEKAFDAQCLEVEDFSNFSLGGVVDKHTLNNYNRLRIRFGNRYYIFTPDFNGTTITARFVRATT